MTSSSWQRSPGRQLSGSSRTVRAEKRGVVWTRELECRAGEWAKQQTRKAKPEELDLAKVKADCIRVCGENGDDIEEVVRKARRRAMERTPGEVTAEAEMSREAVRDALDLAILHHLERESVFSAEELETHSLTQHRYAGLFDLDDVRAEVERRLSEGLLIRGVGLRGETLYTTKGMTGVAAISPGRSRARRS